MSGIAAIANLGGGPIDRESLGRMAAAIDYRGPDTTGDRADGPVGLASALLWTTPEAVGEQQPGGWGTYRIVADARIDNREDLLPLIADRLPPGRASDTDVILASYARWAERCAEFLVGDFAFVIWNAATRSIFAARDALGVRQLVYARRGPLLMIGTTTEAVIAGPGTRPDLNRPLIAAFVAGAFNRWVFETAYQGIARLPAGYRLSATVGDDCLSVSRYYVLGKSATRDKRTDAEYVEEFHTIFRQSVRARLRSPHPVGVMVSGGLDSSSIACTAEQFAADRAGTGSARMYSCVFDKTPEADEREYLQEVVDGCRHLSWTPILSDDCWALCEFGDDNTFPLDEPEPSCDRGLLVRPARRARRDGCRAMLTGHSADQLLVGDAYHLPVVIRDVELAQLRRELRHFRDGDSPAWRMAAYSHVRPYVPFAVKKVIRWLRRDPVLGDFARGEQERDVNLLPAPRGLSDESARLSYHQLTNGLAAVRLASLDAIGAHTGLEWRFPFLDRRLVDFVLTLPSRLRFRNGLAKFVLREAMNGVLPEKVRGRTTFARFDELIHRGLRDRERRRVMSLLEDARIVREGLVDPQQLRTVWDQYASGNRDSLFRPLARSLCIESWLRMQEARQVASGTPLLAEAIGQ